MSHDFPTGGPRPPITPSGGIANVDSIPPGFDPVALRAGRLTRLRAMMAEKDYAALILLDPNNQLYATGSRNMFGYFPPQFDAVHLRPARRSDHPVRISRQCAYLDLA